MKIRNIIILGLFSMGIIGCSPYEEYIKDFDYSIVYFGTQKPLRTIVAYDDMQFKVGVALGGKRENNTNEIIKFVIDPELLQDQVVTEGNNFALLPSNYYSLSHENTMIVKEGSFVGDIIITLNTDAFANDPLALSNNYALPLRLTESTTDSIASGSYDVSGNVIVAPKDYTIVVVKYISPWHGTYYHKGLERELDNDGNMIDETIFNQPDLIRNQTRTLTSLKRFEVLSSGIGTNTNASFIISRADEGDIALSSNDPNIMNFLGTGVYDDGEKAFYLNYSFQNAGRNFEVVDTLVIRQAPEKDLRFEEW